MNPRTVVGLCAAVLILDGFDAQAMGYVVPSIARDFHVAPPSLAPAISIGLFGLMLGALILGPVADRIGRKPVLLASVAAFGLFALLTSTVHGVPMLMLARLLTGFGLGGAMPNAVSLAAEYATDRWRPAAVMTIFGGFSLGAAVGGTISAALLTRFGWPAVFIVGGVLPIVLVPILVRAMPESQRWLAQRGKVHERVPIGRLFADGRAATTLLLWIAFFMNLLALYFSAAWLPTVLVSAGIAVPAAVATSSLFQYGGVVGSILISLPTERFGPRWVMFVTFVAALIGVVWIGRIEDTAIVPLAVTFTGFFLVGAQAGLNGLAAICYPTAIRATGVGWTLGVGRIGSISGPLLGGLLLAHNKPTPAIFTIIAIPLGICALAMLLLRLRAVKEDPLPA